MAKEITDDQDFGKVFFGWQFSEFPKYERKRGWYIWGAIVVVLFVVYSIATANFLFALITIISALTVLLFKQSDNFIDFKITEDGIVVDKKFYEYKEIKNFYIIYEPPEVKTLYFEPKSFFSPRIPIHLEDQNPVLIRKTLLQYLDEDLDRENEPTSDQFSRLFKL
jgi:hypothetical protein